MGTNDNFLNITSKRILGVEDFEDRFFNYLRSSLHDAVKQMYSIDMVFGSQLTVTDNGNDALQIVGSSIVTDAQGHFIDPANGYQGNLAAFENENAVDYYIGLHYCEIPKTVQINPRTGLPEYAEFFEEVGLSGTPDTVVDNGNDTITFNINSLLESGVDHKNRYVTIYKITPDNGAISDAIAIETVQSTFIAPNNFITTAGTLGQTIISTTPSDYVAVLRGPVVSRNTDLEAESDYAFIGTVTGSGAGTPPTTFDVTSQNVLPVSLPSSVFEGFDNDLFPATDAVYSLGTASKKWSAIYTNSLSVSGDFRPLGDDSQNLGAGSLRWKNLYISGLVNGNLRPQGSGIYGLGTDSNKWGDVYCQRLHISSYLYGNLIPWNDNGQDLGDSTHSWKDFYIDGSVQGNLIPTSPGAYDLGSSSYRWGDLYCSTLVSNFVGSHLVPNGAYNLGSNSDEWATIYVTNTRTDTITGESSSTVQFNSVLFKPSSPAGADLGDVTDYWDNVYCAAMRTNFLFPRQFSNISLNGNFTLQTDDTYSMGSSTEAFTAIYSHLLSTDELEARFGSAISVKDDFNPIDGTKDLGTSSLLWSNLYVSSIHVTDIDANASGEITIDATMLPGSATREIGSSSNPWKEAYLSGAYRGKHTDGGGNMWHSQFISAVDMLFKRITTIDQSDFVIIADTPYRKLVQGTDTISFSTWFGKEGAEISGNIDLVVEVYWLCQSGTSSTNVTLDLDLRFRGEHGIIPTASTKSVAHDIESYNSSHLHKTVFVFQSVSTSGSSPYLVDFKIIRNDSNDPVAHIACAVLKYRSAVATEIFYTYPSEG